MGSRTPKTGSSDSECDVATPVGEDSKEPGTDFRPRLARNGGGRRKRAWEAEGE